MERYGHDSPPKVMRGVDDDIRKLFRDAESKLQELRTLMLILKNSQKHSKHFRKNLSYDLQRRGYLLMILLETFTQDDWLSIAEEVMPMAMQL